MLQHVRMPASNLLDQLDRFPGVGAIVQAYGQIDSPQPIAKGPVCYPFRNQLRVGDDDISPLFGTHSAGADADPTDITQKVAYLYGVAHRWDPASLNPRKAIKQPEAIPVVSTRP